MPSLADAPPIPTAGSIISPPDQMHRRRSVLNSLGASHMLPAKARRRAIRAYGVQLDGAYVESGCFFGSQRVTIGASYVNVGCFFDALDQITIGDGCQIGMQVLFCTSTHELGPSTRRADVSKHAPITVGDGVWIGARSTILPGVTIATGCVIAAASVVTSSTEPNGLYAGTPARRIKDLD